MKRVLIGVLALSLFGCGLPKESTLEQIGQEIGGMKADLDELIKKLEGGKIPCGEETKALQELSLRLFNIQQDIKR